MILEKKKFLFFCNSYIQHKNGSLSNQVNVNWNHSNDFSYFEYEKAFKTKDLNLTKGDSLFIYLFSLEEVLNILDKKFFYIAYDIYILDSNNKLKAEHVVGKYYFLYWEMKFSLENKVFPFYIYKMESNIINDRNSRLEKFSSITEYENVRFMPLPDSLKNKDVMAFIIQIEETKELRTLEVVEDHSIKDTFFSMLGSISITINIIPVIYYLYSRSSCRKRVLSSEINSSLRVNLPQNENNNNNNGDIDIDNQNA